MTEIEVVEVVSQGISVVEVTRNDGVIAVEVTVPDSEIAVVEVQIPGLGGGSGSSVSGDPQTPWASDIDAAGYNLNNLGYIMLGEISDPSAPAANKGILYLRDDGSGITQACIRFANGNILVLGQDT